VLLGPLFVTSAVNLAARSGGAAEVVALEADALAFSLVESFVRSARGDPVRIDFAPLLGFIPALAFSAIDGFAPVRSFSAVNPPAFIA